MKRTIARWTGWWTRLFVLSVFLLPQTGWPAPLHWSISAGLLGLALVRAPWDRDRPPVAVDPPVRGRWVAVNSPATKVPSHGLPPTGRPTPSTSCTRTRPAPPLGPAGGSACASPTRFSTFGEPVHAVADGVVVATSSRQRDHLSRLTWPSLLYLMTIEGFLREVGGARFVLGNHVIVDQGDGVHAAYAHLRRQSLQVKVGDRVQAGQPIGEVGNSGNTSEPHLHVQLMDDPSITAAAGVPFRWRDIEVRPGDVDPSRSTKPVPAEVEPGLPANGQVFTAA